MAQEAGRRKKENPPLILVGRSTRSHDGNSTDLEDFPEEVKQPGRGRR